MEQEGGPACSINMLWRECGIAGTRVPFCWECAVIQLLWKTVWQVFFFIKLNIHLPYDPVIPFPDTPRKRMLSKRQMLTVDLFIVAQNNLLHQQ